MRLLSVVSLVLLLAVASMGQLVGNCAHWNGPSGGADGGHSFNHVDYQWHLFGGLHQFNALHAGKCEYVCPSGQCQPLTQCIATVTSNDTPDGEGDHGVVTQLPGPPQFHVRKIVGAGSTNTNNGQVTSPSSVGYGVAQCPLSICGLSLSVQPTGGVTFGVTGGFQVWDYSDTYNAFCQDEKAYPVTPIIIDTGDEGFQLTDAAGGVTTEMVDPGHTIDVAWTQPTSHNAFLWLDGHLFGNSTPQQPSDGCPDPSTGCGNGFEALDLLDSNGDGVIDASDPVFSQLRLWVDSNHDGVVQPGELFPLPGDGAIFLRYSLDKKTDANGNVFRYKGHFRAKGVDHTIYDVELTLAQ